MGLQPGRGVRAPGPGGEAEARGVPVPEVRPGRRPRAAYQRGCDRGAFAEYALGCALRPRPPDGAARFPRTPRARDPGARGRRAPLRAAAGHAGGRRNPSRHPHDPRVPRLAGAEGLPRGGARALSRYFAGTSSSALSQTSALPSEGARQSPRGESEPPEPTFGAFGMALRLYWLIWKKRRRNTPSHLRMEASLYLSCHALQQRKATFAGA